MGTSGRELEVVPSKARKADESAGMRIVTHTTPFELLWSAYHQSEDTSCFPGLLDEISVSSYQPLFLCSDIASDILPFPGCLNGGAKEVTSQHRASTYALIASEDIHEVYFIASSLLRTFANIMARTRAQDKAEAGGTAAPKLDNKAEKDIQKPAKRSRSNTDTKQSTKAKTAKTTKSASKDEATDSATAKSSNPKIDQLISQYATELPLQHLLKEPSSPTPETILAHLLNAFLSSARISHAIAAKTVECVLKAGYHDIATLKKSSWEERTVVLTDGGYTRYREKTATALGELVEMIESKYYGDLNSLLNQTKSDPKKIRAALKEVKGLGDVGVGVFCDTAQHLWTCLAPALDSRSIKTAEAVGLGSDVDALWNAIGKDAEKMCRLAVALTEVRLQKAEKDFA